MVYGTALILTQQVLGSAGHSMGIEGREDATLASAHVEAPEPEVVLLHLHQHRVIYVQLQLIRVTWDEPESRDRRALRELGDVTGTGGSQAQAPLT